MKQVILVFFITSFISIAFAQNPFSREAQSIGRVQLGNGNWSYISSSSSRTDSFNDCGLLGSITERLIDCKSKNPDVFDTVWNYRRFERKTAALLVTISKKNDLRIFAYCDYHSAYYEAPKSVCQIQLIALPNSTMDYKNGRDYCGTISEKLKIQETNFGIITEELLDEVWQRYEGGLLTSWLIEGQSYWAWWNQSIVIKHAGWAGSVDNYIEENNLASVICFSSQESSLNFEQLENAKY